MDYSPCWHWHYYFKTTTVLRNRDVLQKTLQIDAVYYSDRQHIEISYLDTSDQTDTVVLEVLGLDTTFQKKFFGSEFVETVPFSSEPKFGWAVHPIVP